MTLACVYIAVIVPRYLTFEPEVYFIEQREAYLQLEFALGVHVLSGVLALLIGPFQFVPRRRFVRIHRFLGATYVASATARRVGPDPRSDGLHRSGGIRRLHGLGPGPCCSGLGRPCG
jgi:hypothetical protein